MRLSIIRAVFSKEVKDIVRDKKTLFSMIILPILLYPILMVATSQIMMLIETQMDEAKYVIMADESREKHHKFAGRYRSYSRGSALKTFG